MLPLALDLTLLPTALVGSGRPLLKRLSVIDGEARLPIRIFAPDPDAAVRSAAGLRLIARLPSEAELAAMRVLFVAGLPAAEAEHLTEIARAHRILVNVEDVPLLCDFHVPAIVRRGDLAISVSTGGTSPTLARRLRAYLETILPEVWAERTSRAARLRDSLREQGAGPAAVMKAIDALIDDEGWLADRRE